MTLKLKLYRSIGSLMSVSGAAALLLAAHAQSRTAPSEPTALELSSIQQLTFAHGEEENAWPSWSPDSRKLVFQKIIPGYSTTHLFIMNAVDGRRTSSEEGGARWTK